MKCLPLASARVSAFEMFFIGNAIVPGLALEPSSATKMPSATVPSMPSQFWSSKPSSGTSIVLIGSTAQVISQPSARSPLTSQKPGRHWSPHTPASQMRSVLPCAAVGIGHGAQLAPQCSSSVWVSYGVLVQPGPSTQSSAVQSSASEQSIGTVTHAPSWHSGAPLQTKASSWQSVVNSHAGGTPQPTPSRHARPSSHSELSGTLMQPRSSSLQESTVHEMPSPQFGGEVGTHAPSRQTSEPLQNSPSSTQSVVVSHV